MKKDNISCERTEGGVVISFPFGKTDDGFEVYRFVRVYPDGSVKVEDVPQATGETEDGTAICPSRWTVAEFLAPKASTGSGIDQVASLFGWRRIPRIYRDSRGQTKVGWSWVRD